jgi:hypothetical protein
MAFFVGEALIVRHRAFHSRSLFLNATGNAEVDRLYIEYNAMLGQNAMLDQEDNAILLDAVLALLPKEWDEFSMPGLDVTSFPGNVLGQGTRFGEIEIERDVPSPYVDLEMVRQNNGDYISLLSKKTRYEDRRSHQAYAERGPVTLEVAQDQNMAFSIFDEMVSLHQKSWQERGETGVFASDFFLHFHRRLIQKRFDFGEIQLLRAKAGANTIGCLYSFVYHRKVYFYQSGFNYEEDKRLTPGFTTLIEAVQYNAAIDNLHFDFLGGDANYKSKLCTHEQRLMWAKVQRPRLQFRLETWLKALKRGIRSRQSEKVADAKKA